MIQPQTKSQHRAQFLIQPGWQNSGPHHWQTQWEARLGASATRVPQQDWMVPDRKQWVPTLERAIEERAIEHSAQPVVILAHSIGCMATILAVQKMPVAAVVLVAPPDAERKGAPEALQSFTPIPMERVGVPALLIASDNDPYCTLKRAEDFAQAWKADIEIVPGGGHLNGDSGFGPWPEGWQVVGEWLRRHGLGWPEDETTHA